MRRRTQAYHLRPQLHRTVVLVVGDVVKCGVDGHFFRWRLRAPERGRILAHRHSN
ncbi:hypothetical protein APY03_6805 [Variovorax sp. WDL1]|nr:hypothetical protein APY03_6805 [Variovorax sp. WDL1]